MATILPSPTPTRAPACGPALIACRHVHAGEAILVRGCSESRTLLDRPAAAPVVPIGVNHVGRLCEEMSLGLMNLCGHFTATSGRGPGGSGGERSR
jgi:hypothetical protein